MLLYQILASTTHGKKHKKSHTWIINLKHKLRIGIKIFNYLMDSRLFRVSHQKNIQKWLIIEKYKNKIENWITFKTKAVYYILTPDTIKLLASNEKKRYIKMKIVKMYMIQKSLKSIMILLTMVINMIRESFVLPKNR